MTPVAQTSLITRDGGVRKSDGPALYPVAVPADRARDLWNVAASETSALLAREVGRYREDWRKTLTSVKDTLAGLERACEDAIGKEPVEPTAAISALVDKVVASASAAAEAAAQRTRAEAKAEIAQIQAGLGRLQAELEAERGKVKQTAGQLEAAQAERTQAEAARDEARRMRQEALDAVEAQLDGLRRELESRLADVTRLREELERERAERAALVAAIQRALAGSSAAAQAAAAPAKPDGSNADPTPARVTPVKAMADPSAPSPTEPSVAPPAPRAEANPQLVEYARQLLGAAESMYWADIGARRSCADLVDRLTSNLRSARELFARRVGGAGAAEHAIFDQELTEMLDAGAATSYGRHLGIAAYESSIARAR